MRNPLYHVSFLSLTLWAICLPLILHPVTLFFSSLLPPLLLLLLFPPVLIPSAMNMDRFEKGPREILNPEIQKVRAAPEHLPALLYEM